MVCQSGYCISGIITVLLNHMTTVRTGVQHRSRASSPVEQSVELELLLPHPRGAAFGPSAAESRALAQAQTGVAVLQAHTGFPAATVKCPKYLLSVVSV